MRLESSTRKIGQCEVCQKEGIEITVHYNNMWFCSPCWDKEKLALEDAKNLALSKFPLPSSNPVTDAVKQAEQIDSSIEVKTDLFNAATVSIVALKTAVDADPAIDNKPYRLAELLKERFEHYKVIVFDLNEKLADAANNQKAIQVYLNQLANQLRQDERDKLRLADISYKPTGKPVVKAVKTSQTAKHTRLNKVELRKYAAELGITEFTLQMVCVQKGISVETAANMLRKSIKEAQSEAK